MQDTFVATWGQVIALSFNRLFGGVLVFVPKLIFAFLVFFIGLVVSVFVGRVIAQAVRALRIDHVLRSLGLEEYFDRAGFRMDSGAFVGGLVKWFFILVFLMAALNVLELNAVTSFLGDAVLTYLPNVIVAAFVLLIAAVLGDVASAVASGAARAAKIPSAGLVGAVVRWSIWIFALLAALTQLGIFRELIIVVVQAVVYMLALAGGLAFGLGGKEAAARFIEKMSKEVSNHH
jgi:hypothetical protein